MPLDQYDFVWTDPTKPGFTVEAQTKDTTSTTLTITGRGSQNWGRDLQQNLLLILESFAGPTPPIHPTTGQLWYDTTNKRLNVYDAAKIGSPTGPWTVSSGSGVESSTTAPITTSDGGALWFNPTNQSLSLWDGTKWNKVYPTPDADLVKVAFFQEYNALTATLNKIVGSPTGATLALAFGYNQTDLVVPAEDATTMNNTKWLTFLATLTKICTFLGIDTSGIGTYGFMYDHGNNIPCGITTLLQQYNTTVTALTAISAGNVRYKPIAGALESSTPAAGTVVRTTPWQGSISRDVVVTFPNATSMNSYFNAGGQIQFVTTITNAITQRDIDTQLFYNTLGTIKFSVTGSVDSANHTNTTGFYDLTGVAKTIFVYAEPAGGKGSDNTCTITAKLDSPNVIRFHIVQLNPGTLYNGIGGTMTSKAIIVKPSSLYMDKPVIALPTITSTAFA